MRMEAGWGWDLLRMATTTMVARLSTAAMIGILTFLKVSSGVRDLRRGVTSVEGGKEQSTFGGCTCQGLQPPHPLALGELWGQFCLALGLFSQTRLSFLAAWTPTSFHLPGLVHLSQGSSRLEPSLCHDSLS